MTTWKKYGGTSKLDAMNNITVNSIVSDYFSLRKVYVGTFDISGILHVSGKITTETNLYSNNIINKGNISTDTIHINKDAVIAGNIILTSNQYVYAGDVYLYNNMDISGNLSVRKTLYLGYAGAYLNGEDMCGNIGINTKTPTAALDISTNQLQSINVKTSQPINYSVLTRNIDNQGISLYTDLSSSNISFYNDGPININGNYDGQIEYRKGGTLNLDVSDNVNIFSKAVVSNDKTLGHLMGEQMAIHDTLNTTPFLSGIYENPNIYAGNALSLVGANNQTNTFLNIVTPNKKGFSIGGGPYPNNTNRTIGTIGWTDPNYGYVPSLTILSGQSLHKLKTTIGVNNNAPTTDKYSLEVNGPIRIRNGEISRYIEPGYEILSVSYLKTNPNQMIYVGSPYTLNKNHKIVYTLDGGETWNLCFDLSGKSIETFSTPVNINSVYIYDSSLVFIAGDYGFVLYSNNSGANWYSITLPVRDTHPVYSGINVRITSILSTASRIYLAYKNNTITLGYIYHILKPVDIYTDTNGFPSSDSRYINTQQIQLINYMVKDEGYLYAIGENNIERYTLPYLTSPQIYTNPLPITYKHICNFDGSNVIAVGTNIITYTHTNEWSSPSEWTSISVPYVLNSVYIYDASRAMAVGDSGTIIYTDDGYNTWKTIALNTLNSSGNAAVLLNRDLKFILMKNLDEFVVTKTTTNYNGINTLGNSAVYGCYMPTMYNNVSNYVMDISGIATISGDMRVNDGGKITTNNSTFDLLNENVNNINFGTNSLNTTMGGNAYIPRLGVGTHTITNTYAMEISGNMLDRGYIWQF